MIENEDKHDIENIELDVSKNYIEPQKRSLDSVYNIIRSDKKEYLRELVSEKSCKNRIIFYLNAADYVFMFGGGLLMFLSANMNGSMNTFVSTVAGSCSTLLIVSKSVKDKIKKKIETINETITKTA